MRKSKKKVEETEILDIDDKDLAKKLFDEVEELDDVELLDENIKYYEDEEEQEDYYEDKKTKVRRPLNYYRILKIVLALAIIIVLMISIDVISISRFNKGPFFAIPVKTYRDGGTKEYYGIGYKVIKYHQGQGRRDTELGTWNLKYNTLAINIKDIDLALEFHDNKAETIDKYNKKFVRIDTSLQSIDNDNNTLLLGYKDEEGDKYSLNIKCEMVKKDLDKFTPGNEIMILGTFSKYNAKTNTVTISNCFAEQ